MPFAIRSRRRWLSAVLLLLFTFACQKNDDSVAAPRTVADLIQEDARFTLLRAAVGHAEAGDLLKGANLTLFAPTDSAFAAAGLATPATITSLPKAQVRAVLLTHVLTAPVASSELLSGQSAVPTAGNGVVYVNRTAAQITVNGARVTQADWPTANGTVHVIDRLLTPSAATLSAVVQNRPDLTFLAAALRRAGTTNAALAMFSNPTAGNGVTVFAPNDAAFRSAGYASVAAVEAASPQTLASLLTYHLIAGIQFSRQLQAGPVNTLSSGNRLTLAVTNGVPTVKGTKNTTPAGIVTPDLPAPNGVVHVINQVLQP